MTADPIFAAREIDRLATFLLDNYPHAIGDESAVDVAIKLLDFRSVTLEAMRGSASPSDASKTAMTETSEGGLIHIGYKLAHLGDLYHALGVEWGEDPFARIASLSGLPARAYLPVFGEIARERQAQDAEWGGPEHDDEHNVGQWAHFIRDKVAKADLAEMRMVTLGTGEDAEKQRREVRRRLIQVASLAVAAIESFDRKYPADAEVIRA